MNPRASRPAGGVPADRAPVIRIGRGDPTDQEIAAVVAALAAVCGPEAAEPSTSGRTLWTARARFAPPALTAGPGSWRASALPR